MQKSFDCPGVLAYNTAVQDLKGRRWIVMQAQDPRLLSKLSLLISENDFHAKMHDHGANDSFYYHYHDYYEVTFYLGEQDAAYLQGNIPYAVRKGDIIFCRMFENHIMDYPCNDGHARFCIGIEPRILGNYSKKNANLYLMFSNQNRTPALQQLPQPSA